MSNKKGIGPVVATSLLIVVAVVSLVGFQSWFNTYSSEMYLDVESQSSDSISASGIEAVVGESLYFKNGFGKNISIFSVSIDGYDCNVSGNRTSGMKDLNISLCINNVTSATPEVVVITDKGIFSEKIYLKELGNSNSESSSLPIISLTISSNVSCYNIFSEAGSPVNGVDVRLIILSDVYVGSDISGCPSINTGSFNSSSIISITNNGYIIGKGGKGSHNLNCNDPFEDGGDAINLEYDISLDNTNGFIGGGGGGARDYFCGDGCTPDRIYAGGGGAGIPAGSGGGPGNGCVATVHLGFNGGVFLGGAPSAGFETYLPGLEDGWGGDLGEDGGGGGTDLFGGSYFAPGGIAGKAINLNGNSVTWLGGNNTVQVKGFVS